MKETIFWILYLFSAGIISYKLLKSMNYFNAKFKEKKVDELYKQLSVIQVVEELGDVVEANIKNNTKTLENSHFIFVIEKEKIGYKKRIEEILREEKNLSFDILEVESITINEKIRKALEISKEYILILNENIEIEGNIDEMLEELEINEFIVNGLTYKNKTKGLYSAINSAFYNCHILFSFLALAEIGKEGRVNSHFFASRKNTLIKNKIFDDLNENELDEVEIAKKISKEEINIFQSKVLGKNRHRIKNRLDFVDSIGREIDIFLELISETTDIKVYFLTVLPIVLPSVTFIYSALLGTKYVVLVLVSLFIKSFDVYLIKKLIIKKTVGIAEIFLEFFIDIFGIVFIVIRKNR